MQRDSPRPRVVTPELVLVSGYSGIGKSSVVHELHKVPSRRVASSRRASSTSTLNTRIAQIGLRLDRVGEIEEAKQPAFTPKRKSKNNAVTRFLGLWSTATGLVIGGMGPA